MRRIVRYAIVNNVGVAPGATSRVAVVATGPCQIAMYRVTTDCTKSDDKRLLLTIQRGTTPGTLGTAVSTGAQLEATATSNIAAYGTGCDAPGSPTTLASAWINAANTYPDTLGVALESGQAVTFALTSDASTITNPIKFTIEVVVENT